MERGWRAAGLLKPLWERLPGKRDQLAALTGITPQTLSAYNSGSRQLGLTNARRIADALDVSVLELGAPLERVDEAGMNLLDRLRALEAAFEGERQRFDFFVEETVARLAELEAARGWRAQ